jgi:quercetin dioxygenase-like cupin family protein
MAQKSNDPTPQRPEGGRLLDAPLMTIDLLTWIREVKAEETWKDSDKNSMTLYKTPALRIVLIALHQAAEIPPHKAEGVMSLQLLEGSIEFTTPQQSETLHQGHILTLHSGITHSIIALEESVFLLTLTTPEKNHEG